MPRCVEEFMVNSIKFKIIISKLIVFIEDIYDFDKKCEEDFWLILKKLLLMEDWFIKYKYWL